MSGPFSQPNVEGGSPFELKAGGNNRESTMGLGRRREGKVCGGIDRQHTRSWPFYSNPNDGAQVWHIKARQERTKQIYVRMLNDADPCWQIHGE